MTDISVDDLRQYTRCSLAWFRNGTYKTVMPALSLPHVLPAYCVAIYRNKLIIHHDVHRRNSAVYYPPVEYHLFTFPSSGDLSIEDIRLLKGLWEKYKQEMPEQVHEEDFYGILRILFYNISLVNASGWNSDRDVINSLAEHGGCESLDRHQLLAAVGRFSMAVVSALGP